MTAREYIFCLGGLASGLLAGALGFAFARATGTETPSRSSDQPAAVNSADSAASDDPAMIANANLANSLRECNRQLAELNGEKSFAEQELSDERSAEADASRSAVLRRIARRDPSQNDWKELARTGTVRYTLPCAAFNPSPQVVQRLGLAPQDSSAIHDAFGAARNAAWAQVRPFCSAALGSERDADALGLEACPGAILNSAKSADPQGSEDALRTVALVRAGLADAASISGSDAVGVTFLAMTGISRDAEVALSGDLGPAEARAVVFGNNGCSHTMEFTAPVPAAGQGVPVGSQ